MAKGKSWQTRIAQGNDALAQAFVESISYDWRLYKHDIAGSIAHATMLQKVGLLSVGERRRIERGLKSIQRDIEAGRFVFDPALEDIHMAIEAALIQRTGNAGRKLHTGRSRNDQVALDLVLWARQAAGEMGQCIDELSKAWLRLAQRCDDIVMPAYTHLQRAQPILASAEALAWVAMLQRDAQRFSAIASARPDIPLGSGAIAGTALAIDPSITARLLDFEGPPVNGIEQTASREMALDLLFALATTSMHLSRWAEQWIIYSSSEFAFVKLSDRHTTGSSMMPQKRNPDLLELIRGRCGGVYGNLMAMLTILKGLPVGYNRDLQEDKRLVFGAYDTVLASLTMAAAIVDGTRFERANIEPTLERGFLDATSLAEYFVSHGVAFRTAHQVVGRLVAQCEREGKTALGQLKLDDFRAALKAAGQKSALVKRDVFRALGARNVVQRYRSAGSAGPASVRAQIKVWKKKLGA